MYKSVLIPTDGSELAEKAVRHGIAFSKEVGAKVTMVTVSTPFHMFTTDSQMMQENPAQYKKRIQDHAAKILSAAAETAKAVGVTCETVHVEHEHLH
jgi:nucleotide-binding universal stress UspA family protein